MTDTPEAPKPLSPLELLEKELRELEAAEKQWEANLHATRGAIQTLHKLQTAMEVQAALAAPEPLPPEPADPAASPPATE